MASTERGTSAPDEIFKKWVTSLPRASQDAGGQPVKEKVWRDEYKPGGEPTREKTWLDEGGKEPSEPTREKTWLDEGGKPV